MTGSGPRRNRRGLTLIEGIVAGALAVILGLILLHFIRASLAAHRKGQLSRTAQAGTRELIAFLVSELRSSSVPPLTPAVSSPVYWPGVWGPDFEGASLGPYYPREVTADDPQRDESHHRLLYVRTAEGNSSAVDPLTGYALTELLVTETIPGAVERRVHRMSGNGFLKTTSVTGADSLTRSGWVLDSAAFLAAPAPTQPDLVFDAGPDSRVSFRVSHPRYEPPSDPGRTRNPELYDPGTFRLEVVVAYGPRRPKAFETTWPQDEDWDVRRTEITEIRIPSVRSSR